MWVGAAYCVVRFRHSDVHRKKMNVLCCGTCWMMPDLPLLLAYEVFFFRLGCRNRHFNAIHENCLHDNW